MKGCGFKSVFKKLPATLGKGRAILRMDMVFVYSSTYMLWSYNSPYIASMTFVALSELSLATQICFARVLNVALQVSTWPAHALSGSLQMLVVVFDEGVVLL